MSATLSLAPLVDERRVHAKPQCQNHPVFASLSYDHPVSVLTFTLSKYADMFEAYTYSRLSSPSSTVIAYRVRFLHVGTSKQGIWNACVLGARMMEEEGAPVVSWIDMFDNEANVCTGTHPHSSRAFEALFHCSALRREYVAQSDCTL